MTEKKDTSAAKTPKKEQQKEQKSQSTHKRAGGGGRTDATKPNGEDTERDTEHISQSNKKDNKKESMKEPEKQKPKDDIKTTKAKKEEPKKAKQKPSAPAKGEWNILKFPHLSEKSISNIEMQNKIIFIVKPGSKRSEIKKAVESMFEVKVEKINMLTTAKGDKKAFVKLKPDYSALDIATRLGMM